MGEVIGRVRHRAACAPVRHRGRRACDVPCRVLRASSSIAALLALIGVARASDSFPVEIEGGVSRLTSRGARDAVDETGGGLGGYGWHAGIGISANESALIGYPWIELAVSRHADAKRGHIESFSVLYIERVAIGELAYLGGGVGSFYDDVAVSDASGGANGKAWRLGARGVFGLNAGRGVYAELGIQYAGSVAGVACSSADLSIGLRF
jgi:hypothetical protein